VSDYFERRKKRIVITILKAYVGHVKSDLNLKIPLTYYYLVYLWLGKQKGFDLAQPFAEKNKSKKVLETAQDGQSDAEIIC